MKLTKRKGFNFFRSYYDVYNELENSDDKVAFIDALLDKQFLDLDPTDLTGMSKFAFISQTNSIETQVKGYNDRMKSLKRPLLGQSTPPPQGVNITPPQGVSEPPPQQEQVQVQEKEKVQEQVQEKQKRFSFRKNMCDLGLPESLVDDFLKNRKLKKLANTKTAFNNLVIEFEKNGTELENLMNLIVSNGWGGFKNSWMEKEKTFGKKEKSFSTNRA